MIDHLPGKSRRRRAGQGTIEFGLVMGLIAILAVATLWGLSVWLGDTFIEEAEGTGAQNVRAFYNEMAVIADGRQINSTSTTSSATTTTGTTTTGTTTTSTAATTTSSAPATTSSVATTTSSVPTTTSSVATTTSVNTSTTTTTATTTTSVNTSTTSTTSTTSSVATTTTTTVPVCNPTVTSVRNSDGTCNWTTNNQNVNVRRNRTIAVTVNLGGDTWCVTGVTAAMDGNALSSLTPASDATAPYQFTFTTVNSAARWSRITFSVMEGAVVRRTFNIEISTQNSATCQ